MKYGSAWRIDGSTLPMVLALALLWASETSVIAASRSLYRLHLMVPSSADPRLEDRSSEATLSRYYAPSTLSRNPRQ